MSGYRLFDRHDCFNQRTHEQHSRNVSDVSDWGMWEEDKNMFSSVHNKLCGIWDGYLYDGLVQECIDYGVPKFVVMRIEDVVTKIEKYINKTNS